MPTAGGSTITLSGMTLGGQDYTPTVAIGSTRAIATTFISYTSVSFVSPAGTGVGFPSNYAKLGVTLAGLSFSFDPPAVQTPGAFNAPHTGGSTLTITGVNFANRDPSVSVLVGTTGCATNSWISATQLRCAVSKYGFGDAGPLKIEAIIDGQSGTAVKFFSYDGAVITFQSNVNAPQSGGTSLTISGFNFGGYSNPTPSLSIGNSLCVTTSWVSNTQLQCNMPMGFGAVASAKVTIGKIAKEYTGRFSFDSPAISFSVNANGPTTGASSVTIHGMNFGSSDASGSVQTGSATQQACATTSWSTATQLTCQLADSGSGAGLLVTFLVSASTGTFVGAFSFDSPVTTNVVASNAPAVSGTTITLSGLNFKKANPSPTVTIGSTSCTSVQWVSDTALVCGVDKGTPVETGGIRVSVTGNVGSTPNAFTYDGPTVTDQIPINGAASGGTVMTLSGKNFGATDTSMTVAVGPGGALTNGNCAELKWFSDSSLVCKTSGGAGQSISIFLTSAGQQFRAINVFSFDGPVITRYTAFNGPVTTGLSMTIHGYNFGTDNRTPRIKVGNDCATASWTSNTQLNCLTPNAFGNGKLVLIDIRDQIASITAAFSYDSPVLTAFGPGNAPVSVGNTVTISGVNFGYGSVSSTVRLGDTICRTSSWQSATSIQCAPTGYYGLQTTDAAFALQAQVEVGGVFQTAFGVFTFDAPVLTNTATPNIPGTGGASVTITGINFAPVDTSKAVTVGVSNCQTVSWVSASSLTCNFPRGATSGIYLQYQLNSRIGTAATLFSFDAPVLSQTLLVNAPASGTTILTLRGKEFGFASFSQTISVSQAPWGGQCTSSAWVTDTSVTCVVPPGFGMQRHLSLTLGSVGTLTYRFSYDPPVVTQGAPYNAVMSGGTSLTISGLNFAVMDDTPSVLVGRTVCTTTSWLTATALKCQAGSIGDGQALLFSAQLMVAGSATAVFTYDTPVLSMFTVINTPTTGGSSLTLSGMNFGSIDYTVSVRHGFSTCSTSSWTTGTTILCQTAKGTGGKLTLNVITANVGCFSAAFSFDSPIVTLLKFPNTPASGGTYLSFLGSNFGAVDLSLQGMIGLTACPTTSWSTATQIVCLTSSGTGSALSTSVLLDSMTGTGFLHFTFDAPVLTFAQSRNAPTTSGAVLTIQGTNFGVSGTSMTVSPTTL